MLQIVDLPFSDVVFISFLGLNNFSNMINHFHDVWTCHGGGGGVRISGKGVNMYKGVGACFADFIYFFLNIP